MKSLIKLTLFLLLFGTISCERQGYAVLRGYAQGGTYTVKYNTSGTKISPDKVQEAIEGILTDIDTTLSGYNRGSILSRRNAGESVVTNATFDKVLKLSEEFKEMTSGAFDHTSAPLFDVWGFGFTRDSLPSSEAIELAMEESRQGNKMNFNAIAQGFTCDAVASYLHSLGVRDMLVDFGEIFCEGLNPSGKGWTIGIDTPEDGNDIPGKSISGIWISDGNAHGIVTSGNYRKYYIHDGRKYSHTIDPRTGFPVTHNLLSASVISPTAALSDALATAFMVMGLDQAREYVEMHNGIEACLIASDTTWISKGF